MIPRDLESDLFGNILSLVVDIGLIAVYEMQIGSRTEYQRRRAEFGIGTVVSFDAETEAVTVKDEDDDSIWTGIHELTKLSNKPRRSGR